MVIMGGGLAGLTLGLQLAKRRPGTSILIAEKRDGPAPEAAFKVGESTVELSAHYFANVVGLKDHLEAAQNPKAGLRFFFPAGDNRDIARRVEWGSPRWPVVPAYQLDRGRFENELAKRNKRARNRLLMGCRIENVEIGDPHRVTLSQLGSTFEVSCRWVVDATGRAATLKTATRAGPARRSPHQLLVVPPRRRTGHRRLVRRRGLAGPHVRARTAPIQHQPPDGRGLLGLADPARLGADLDRDRRRPAASPVGGDQHVRPRAGLAAPPRAPARRGDRGSPGPDRRLPARRGLLLRMRAGVLARALVPDRRGGRFPRPAVLPRV